MKNILFNLIAILTLATSVQAQSGGVLWMGSRNATGEARAVHAALKKAYDAFLAGDLKTGFAIYTEDASEIGPDGNITHGKKAMEEGWEAFSKMTDKPAVFKYENVQVRLLTPDVALAIWDSEADIVLNGQQIGGKSKDAAVLRKIKGEWKIEFDQLTPMLGMPALDADRKD
ncbi:MAG: nuclear transport factor 2 family protein [Saprospiraceae bacterium]|nr:nuclear transport factor 2 family protein [Saprospiraceae bacterium]